MHQAAYEWVAQHAVGARRVLDIGGRNINGTVRPLFPNAEYVTVDLHGGPGVDVVGDVCNFWPRAKFDVTVCCEVLEHAENWRGILAAAHRLTRKGGMLIVTAAGPGREPHSGIDGGRLRGGEHYENITPEALAAALADWDEVEADTTGEDVRAVAVR